MTAQADAEPTRHARRAVCPRWGSSCVSTELQAHSADFEIWMRCCKPCRAACYGRRINRFAPGNCGGKPKREASIRSGDFRQKTPVLATIWLASDT